MSEVAQQAVTQHQVKPAKDRNGYVYSSLGEKMKYLMRRRRNSPLPHYPHHEPRDH